MSYGEIKTSISANADGPRDAVLRKIDYIDCTRLNHQAASALSDI